jgi:glycosyltransferase involved in cell wall biosynthesis
VSLFGWRGRIRSLYIRGGTNVIARTATLGLGASRLAAECLFGRQWQADKRWRLQSYAIDLTPFRPGLHQGLRASLGIPEDAFVIGHVGRFVPQKNHDFVIRIALEVLRRDPQAVIVLVGDGPLHSKVQEAVVDSGHLRSFVFVRASSQIPDLMKEVMDVFLFPSLFEGLGIVLVEAQAAGLPCVISDTVPEEADLIPALVHRLNLDEHPARWSVELLRAYDPERTRRAKALAIVEASSFNIRRSVDRIEQLYRGMPDGVGRN